MHFTAVFYTLLTVMTAVMASPSAKMPKKSSTGTSGRYIISLKPDAQRGTVKSKHEIVSSSAHDWSIINAFVIDGTNRTALDALLNDPDVEAVEENGIASGDIEQIQRSTPWGLERVWSDDPSPITGPPLDLFNQYIYDDAYSGVGVDAYVLDSGIRTTHTQFRFIPLKEGRARWGATFGPYPSADGNGHGTHVAGTIGGVKFGVAKRVNLIAVKVLGDNPLSGPWSDIISGINWAVGQAQGSGRPSIISMSLSGSANDAVDNAVRAAISRGVHVVVSAGNGNEDAFCCSPAKVIDAITVGAMTIDNTKASFSNFGPHADIMAPGQDVISAWNTSDTALAADSGTSMAAPHVTGVVAYYISRSGNLTPGAMRSHIINTGLGAVLVDKPLPNNIVHNYV
ncbi:serine protease [Flagelloscypha sp. PMI_526]|nr:serine protease [Flagelloscypha sp. PMI_526]